MSRRFISIGECMVEMSGGAGGQYRLGYAGDTFNTAWYARALLPDEWGVDYVTALGNDRYSQDMLAFMRASGIGTAHVRIVAGKRPGLYLIHQDGGERYFTYWRENAAARLLADDRPALVAALGGASLVYFSGITMAILAPRMRGRLLHGVVAAREAGAHIAFDPNVRPALWTSEEVMRSVLSAAASIADTVLPTYADEAALFGDSSAEATAERYLALGVSEVVVKDGANEAIVATSTEKFALAPPRAVESLDPTGAGDAFNAAYLAARLRGAALAAAATEAHRVAGIVVGRPGALAHGVSLRPAAER